MLGVCARVVVCWRWIGKGSVLGVLLGGRRSRVKTWMYNFKI